MIAFSIHDRLNYFGKTEETGALTATSEYSGENSGGVLYVGKGSQSALEKPYGMIATRKDSQGGQLGQPYFAEFFIDIENAEQNAEEITLKVQGAFWASPLDTWTGSKYDPLDADGNVIDSSAAATDGLVWKDVAIFTIPAGEYDGEYHPRVAFSDTKFKHFRCYAEFADTPCKVRAFLHKAVE